MVLVLVSLQGVAIPPSLCESLDQKARAREEQVYMCTILITFQVPPTIYFFSWITASEHLIIAMCVF